MPYIILNFPSGVVIAHFLALSSRIVRQHLERKNKYTKAIFKDILFIIHAGRHNLVKYFLTLTELEPQRVQLVREV